ncbi:hypothetical protein B0T14DRAFT_531869 [Immersiella caudata]|uniref:Peptidase M43 pregnancy-associated plasma-A domain-containing protein n=1 Tax=Immersiella caudata TaxID=314043 RepID=A0AA39TI56_9PEZI|nr:hypothetical protein B0T14DRAFT_531869 [Immersiella caudata]
MKEALHVGDYRNLNLYFRNITAIDYGGICTNPEQQITAEKDPKLRLIRDGCVIAIFSLPGNEHQYMNQGKTVVHEMGHWFGLYHPFHDNGLRENNENPNPCNPTNPDDHVLDTPKMRYTDAMIGTCDTTLNSCPNDNGTDPVRNYMSYSSDDCMDEFTPGQVARMYEIYAKYRQDA